MNDYVTGTLRIHPRGFGFLQPDEREKYPIDIFIPRHLTNGAVDGDTVEVLVHPVVSEKGPEGKVAKIIRRGRSHLAGIVVSKTKKGGGFAYAPLLGEDKQIRLNPSPDRTLQVGDRVIIRILDWGTQKRECQGEMSAYIGHISDPSCDIPAAIEEYGIEEATFPSKVVEQAHEYGSKVTAKEIKGREDLRELECFTIDPDTAKDFDDALSLSQDENGDFHLGVHIADVSHYVKPGTPLDEEARARSNSVYFPGFVIPMLPHELSSHLCSLKPEVNRLAISVLMVFDKQGDLKSYKIVRSVIHSQKRFAYKEAKEVLDGKKKSHHRETLFLMVDLCHRFKKKRYERGSIEFAFPDVVVHTDPQGVPERVELVEYDITHQLVEEFMLKANEMVAIHLSKQGKPLTYRIHDQPTDENLHEFAMLAVALGFKISPQPTIEELQQLFDEARQSIFGQFLATSFIRSMRLASYSTQNVGHYGLALEHYTHFTSPIRRYIDLIVHRLIFDEVDPKEDLEEIALKCSERERLAAKASNSVVNLKKLRLLESLQKKDPQHTYEAVITSIKPFGFAFEITEFLFEGFIPLSTMNQGRSFMFDEKKRRLKNRHSHKSFQTGDKIQVKLVSINLIKQQTEWSIIPSQYTQQK